MNDIPSPESLIAMVPTPDFSAMYDAINCRLKEAGAKGERQASVSIPKGMKMTFPQVTALRKAYGLAGYVTDFRAGDRSDDASFTFYW